LIQDPSVGTGGFLIAADHYIKNRYNISEYLAKQPHYEGMEIERGAYRLCLMNVFLHQMKAQITLGDALTRDSNVLSQADVILANPPFGAKAGSARAGRTDLSFNSSNKQLEFLQHIYSSLKPGGRAAVVLPDNVLFEDSIGRSVRRELMETCNLHTVLRLPTGIFYAQGVKTNVLFFTRCKHESERTNEIWFYDLRTNMPRFGKRSPLTLQHFADFIEKYGPDKYGSTPRVSQGPEGRFRRFTRDEIATNNDSLDITWLKDERASDSQNINDPEYILSEIVSLFDLARLQIETLQAQLVDDTEVR
jgi:type I restriction enzyme M protein